jgi:hypothetical protein
MLMGKQEDMHFIAQFATSRFDLYKIQRKSAELITGHALGMKLGSLRISWQERKSN